MAITAKLQAQSPSDIEMTLTITMKMGEWVDLSRQLPTGYPAWKLGAAITDLTRRAVTHFEAKVDPFE